MEGLIKRVYGKSSEKLDPNQLLMQELILEADKNGALKAQEAVELVHETVVEAHTRRHHGRQALPEHLKRVEHILEVAADEKNCTDCGKGLVHIGDDVTERVDYQPSSLFVNRYVRPKYACGDCECDGCGVKQHPTPEGPIERCEADAGLLAYCCREIRTSQPSLSTGISFKESRGGYQPSDYVGLDGRMRFGTKAFI